MTKKELIEKYTTKFREQQVPYDYTQRLICELIDEINSQATNESENVIDNEVKKKKCDCGKLVPSECDGNCIWDGMGYR